MPGGKRSLAERIGGVPQALGRRPGIARYHVIVVFIEPTCQSHLNHLKISGHKPFLWVARQFVQHNQLLFMLVSMLCANRSTGSTLSAGRRGCQVPSNRRKGKCVMADIIGRRLLLSGAVGGLALT